MQCTIILYTKRTILAKQPDVYRFKKEMLKPDDERNGFSMVCFLCKKAPAG